MTNQPLNIMLTGVGGQGLITLTQILGRAALLNDFEFRSSELHGLSQRGGSVKIHVRYGDNVFSPLVSPGELDLGIAMETQESLACGRFAAGKTELLINDYESPTLAESASEQEVMENLREVTKRIKMIPATQICKKELDNEVVAGVFMLGFAAKRNLLDINSSLIIEAIEQELPEKYWELNKEAFKLAKEFTPS